MYILFFLIKFPRLILAYLQLHCHIHIHSHLNQSAHLQSIYINISGKIEYQINPNTQTEFALWRLIYLLLTKI